MTDETLTKRDFKGVAVAASAVATLLLFGAGWDFFKTALNEDHEKAQAEMHLHLACWARSGQLRPESQLSEYIYCKYGKTSKDKVVQ